MLYSNTGGRLFTQLNPVDDFFKYAKTVHVHEYTRHLAHGTTVVDEHDRIDPDSTLHQDSDIVLDKAAPKPSLYQEQSDDIDGGHIEEQEEDPDEVLGKRTKLKLEKIEHVKSVKGEKADEQALWSRWKQNGMKLDKDLEQLMHSFKPLIAMKANVFKGKVKLIPDAAIDAEFQIRFVEGLRTYNPDKGALSTYIFHYLEKAKRFIGENQNIGRIPENRLYKIKQYQKAQAELAEDHGKIPTLDELAKHLKWPVAEINRIDTELRSDLTSQGFENDPSAITPSKAEEVLQLFKYELSGKELEVYEYLTGQGRKHLTSTGDIAKQTGIPDYQVSRYKESIQKKLRKHMGDK